MSGTVTGRGRHCAPDKVEGLAQDQRDVREHADVRYNDDPNILASLHS